MDHPKFSFEQLLETFPLLLEKVDRLENLLSQNSTPEPEELLSRKETAEFLNISISTLSNWERSGKISPFGMGAKRLYKKSELLENQLVKVSR